MMIYFKEIEELSKKNEGIKSNLTDAIEEFDNFAKCSDIDSCKKKNKKTKNKKNKK